MKDIRVMFIGTPEFAVRMMQTLIDEKYNVVAAVSQPDKPAGRKHLIVPTPVHALANQYHIPCLQPEKMKASAEEILSFKPDLIVTCAYGQMVPDVILNAPKYGCLNIHPSLLPKYRGGAPVHHAIWAGDEETGVCLMEMVKAMDAGRVYDRVYVPIGPDETTEELYAELENASAELLAKALPEYLAGKLTGEVQDESKMSIAHNISKEEEQVHFSEEEINTLYNHVRALIDWPVSYGMIDGKRIKLLKARKKVCSVNQEPGTVLGFHDHAMQIACKGGILNVMEVQPEGKSPMSADAFGNGAGRSLINRKFD
ncbi:MAG: methionyl-tRNA formyltransferase [Erysipelotrichia bacterium]|nr:methionyl-tRNA formyltransferase [Erysipelotrichia bacterium]